MARKENETVVSALPLKNTAGMDSKQVLEGSLQPYSRGKREVFYRLATCVVWVACRYSGGNNIIY